MKITDLAHFKQEYALPNYAWVPIRKFHRVHWSHALVEWTGRDDIPYYSICEVRADGFNEDGTQRVALVQIDCQRSYPDAFIEYTKRIPSGPPAVRAWERLVG